MIQTHEVVTDPFDYVVHPDILQIGAIRSITSTGKQPLLPRQYQSPYTIRVNPQVLVAIGGMSKFSRQSSPNRSSS